MREITFKIRTLTKRADRTRGRLGASLRVTRGERVAITRNGLPVALLVPVPSTQKPNAREVIRQLREFRRGITLGGLSLREMIEEGRRLVKETFDAETENPPELQRTGWQAILDNFGRHVEAKG